MGEKAPVTVLFLGDTAVGKTTIIHTKLHEMIDPVPTINTATFILKINGINLLLYDTAGQERFRSTTTFFYRQASIAVIVFDVSNIESFHNLDYWINSLHDYAGTIKYLLVGNKADLGQYFEEGEIKKLADKLDCEYILTSASTGAGIDELFDIIVKLSSNLNTPINTEDSLEMDPETDKRSDCC